MVLSLLGMLARLEIASFSSFRLDTAVLLIAVVALYSLMRDWSLAVAMLSISVIFYVAGAAMPFTVNAILFVLGWALHFISRGVHETRRRDFPEVRAPSTARVVARRAHPGRAEVA